MGIAKQVIDALRLTRETERGRFYSDPYTLVPLEREFSLSGVSSASAGNYAISGTGGALTRALWITPLTGENIIVLGRVRITLDTGSGTFAGNLFCSENALNNGLRLTYYRGSTPVEDYCTTLYSTRYPTNNRAFINSADEYRYDTNTEIVTNRALHLIYNFEGSRRPPLVLYPGDRVECAITNESFTNANNILARGIGYRA